MKAPLTYEWARLDNRKDLLSDNEKQVASCCCDTSYNRVLPGGFHRVQKRPQEPEQGLGCIAQCRAHG
jgi:hypothetical protein